MKAALVGPAGFRAGWRLALFLVVVNVPLAAVQWVVLRVFGVQEFAFTAGNLILAEAVSFVAALAGGVVMGRLERRSLAGYGFPLRGAFGRLFGEGALWGLLSIGGILCLVWLSGGYSVVGLALRGADIAVYAGLWALAFLLASLYEEFYFRGYALSTLATGMGFWPSAILLSLIFGGLHYFLKPQETWIDGLSVTLVGLFFCMTLRRTGSLWFAIGWHTTFNYGSMFLVGSPNTANQGRSLPGHLLDSSFRGPQWLTGGPMGLEASLFVFPILGILFFLLDRRHPEARFPLPGR